MGQSKEHYRAQPIGVDGLFVARGPAIGGFLCTVAGTMTITDASGLVLVDTLPVAPGFNRIPLLFNTSAGGTVQLAGGAAGSLMV